MDAEYYAHVLKSAFLSATNHLVGDEWTLQKENKSVHTAQKTKEFFEAYDINVLDCPAKSPNLNIIKNVCGLLAGKIFKVGRQFKDYIKALYRSLPAYLTSVVKQKRSNDHILLFCK